MSHRNTQKHTEAISISAWFRVVQWPGRSVAVLCILCVSAVLPGCFEVANKKDAIHTEVLPRLEKLEAQVGVTVSDIGAVQAKFRDMKTTITTGGTTHMLILCVVIVLIPSILHVIGHQQNKKNIRAMRKDIDEVRRGTGTRGSA